MHITKKQGQRDYACTMQAVKGFYLTYEDSLRYIKQKGARFVRKMVGMVTCYEFQLAYHSCSRDSEKLWNRSTLAEGAVQNADKVCYSKVHYVTSTRSIQQQSMAQSLESIIFLFGQEKYKKIQIITPLITYTYHLLFTT